MAQNLFTAQTHILQKKQKGWLEVIFYLMVGVVCLSSLSLHNHNKSTDYVQNIPAPCTQLLLLQHSRGRVNTKSDHELVTQQTKRPMAVQ